jgi:hypothetical protein
MIKNINMHKKLFFTLFIVISTIQCVDSSLEIPKQHISENVAKSFNAGALTPNDLQLLCNIFFFAEQYGKINIKLYHVRQKLVFHCLQAKTAKNEASMEKLIKYAHKLDLYDKKHHEALQLWNAATAYLDEPGQEKITETMRHYALEQLRLVEEYLQSNNEGLNTLFGFLKNNIQQTALQTHSIGNCFQAIIDGTLPANHESPYFYSEKIELADRLITHLEKEIVSYTNCLKEFNNQYDRVLILSNKIDTIYYQIFYECLLSYFPEDTNLRTIMFNEKGLIPEDQRIEFLPHVIN